MTSRDLPVPPRTDPPDLYPVSPPTGSDGNTDSTADVAKDQAADVARNAGEAGRHVAGVVNEQTQEVLDEARRQAKDLLRQTQSELTDQAGAQQQRLAAGLRALGDELGSMASGSAQNGMATSLVRQAADRSHRVASWIGSREPGTLLEDVKSFARRRPVAFLALAVGAGLLAGRLTRGIKPDAGDDDGLTKVPQQQPTAATEAPAPTRSSDSGTNGPLAGSVPTDDVIGTYPTGYRS